MANKIAKVPDRRSYSWGGVPSLVAFIVFFGVMGLRLLSPLQWIKFLLRDLVLRDKRLQKRTNFHALGTELYFITAILLLAFALAPENGGYEGREWMRWFSLMLAAEAAVWSFYYLFVRHFVEPTFTIYHHAEYFLAYPLSLAIQLLGLRNYLCMSSVVGLLGRFLDFSTGDKPHDPQHEAWMVTLSLLGALHIVLLLANLRDAFPKTLVKPMTSVAIIGAGDVVRKLVPALTKVARVSPSALRIYDLLGADARPPTLKLDNRDWKGRVSPTQLPIKREQHMDVIAAEIIATGTPTIIATPPDSHVHYLTLLAQHGIRFAVEKPISIFEPEIRSLLSEGGAALFGNGFAMSYFGLEKALPLTYLYRMHPAHHQFLSMTVMREDGESQVQLLPWNEVFDGAGELRRVTLFILEGADRSPDADAVGRRWTENEYLGGIFYETAIHALVVLEKVLGKLDVLADASLELLSYERSLTRDACTFCRISAGRRSDAEPPSTEREPPPSPRAVEVDVAVGKYIHRNFARRDVEIEYENLTVTCDFDAKSLRAVLTRPSNRSLQELAIRVKPDYELNYAVHATLVAQFFETGWNGPRYDDFDAQCKALQSLLGLRDKIRQARQQGMKTYNSAGEGLPLTPRNPSQHPGTRRKEPPSVSRSHRAETLPDDTRPRRQRATE